MQGLTKKAVSILLSVIMIFSPLTVLDSFAEDNYVAVVKYGSSAKWYNDFSEAINQQNNWFPGSTLQLLADVEVTSSIGLVSGARTLDLNGHGIRAAGDGSFSVININGEGDFTLIDSDSTLPHRYTLDSNSLATVNDNAEGTEGEDYFTFTGGYITGGKGNSSCGGGINNSGTLTMSGGTIIGNSANRGGGIYNYGTSNIEGGQIINNTSSGWGGGIYLTDLVANTVNLSGGSITNNRANNGGGIHASTNTTVTVSGSPVVLNNLSSGNNPNNLNLTQGAIISVVGEMGDGASIGVKRSDFSGVLTNSENTAFNVAEKFSSDNSDYVVGKDITSDQLKLHAPYTVRWLNENGDVLETDSDVAEGAMPRYDGAIPTKPVDPNLYAFDKWSPEVALASADATYTATYKQIEPVAKVDDVFFGRIEDAVKANNWSVGSTLTLLDDIDTTASITVPDGAHILDLNGHGIRASAEADFNAITIPAGALLTLNDSGNSIHKYTVDSTGLATVDDNAEGNEGEDYFTFEGGYITGVRGKTNAPSGIGNFGTFTMNAGTVIGNYTERSGAGIGSSGTANINGGQIIYNVAKNWGGGIYLHSKNNTLNLSGGLISHNRCTNNGGGIHISGMAKLNIAGEPVVCDNYTNNTRNNVNIADGGIINVVAALGSGASIGVKKSSNTGVFTNSANTDYNDTGKFISDNANYVVGKDITSGQLKLHTPYTVTWIGDNGEVLETDTNVGEGTIPTYNGETPTKADEEPYFYSFEKWSPDITAVTGDVTYTAVFTTTTAVAKVDNVLFTSFPEAVEASGLQGGANIILLADIDEAYTLAPNQILRVKLNGHNLSVEAPQGAYRLEQTQQADVTVYSLAKLYAEVDGVKYESFAEAAEASHGTKDITLLRNMDNSYNIQDFSSADMLRVKANGFDANVTNAARTQSKKDVKFYFKTDAEVYVDGSADDSDEVIAIAAGALASVVVVEGGSASIVIGAGAAVILEANGANVDLEPENPEEECLQEEEREDGSREIKNLKYHWVTIDTGISILDAGAEVLPDCVNDIWATYNQNISSIIKILPPVLTIVGHTDVILKFPYPEGWFFPPIPYLPEAMNPGSHFIAFFEGTSYTSYGTPFVGKNITEDLEITGIWVPYEAAIEKPNGELEYYLQFKDAASEADGNVVRILSAPLLNYTLKKIQESPAVYETLKVKRGFYAGSCVDSPGNLPKGYKMRTWTYNDENDEVVTCYTIDGNVNPNNGVCLSIGCDITSNFYIDYQAYEGATKLVYTYNSVNEREEYVPLTKEIDLTDVPGELIAGERIKLTVSQAAAQMAEPTHIEILNAYGEVLDALDYSAKTYCENVCAMSDEALAKYSGSEDNSKKLKTLCDSLVAYAEAAQNVFSDYETTKVYCENDAVLEQIANAFITPDYVVDNSGMIKFSSVSFVCTKDARLRLFLDVSGATYTPPAPVITNGSGALKYLMDGGVKKYFVEISGINAADFGEKVTVAYGGSTIRCSVLDFAGIVLKDGSGASAQLKQLAKSLIVYHQNAIDYFG